MNTVVSSGGRRRGRNDGMGIRERYPFAPTVTQKSAR